MEGSDAAALAGGVIGVLIGLSIAIVMLVGMWKTFTKAGKPGWACIIPFYNIIVLLQIAGQPVWLIIGFFIPFINFLTSIWIMHNISKRFGGGIGLTVLLVFSIGWLIIGFGDAKYNPNVA